MGVQDFVQDFDKRWLLNQKYFSFTYGCRYGTLNL